MGPTAANTIIRISEQLRTFNDHWTVYAIGLIVVLYAGTRFMFFLQKSMNHIWRVPTPKRWMRQEVKHRAISAVSIIALVFLATVVTLQKAALITIQKFLGPDITTMIYYIALTLAIYSITATLYKVVPDKKIEWEDVILGAVFTTVVFWAGYFLIRTVIRNTLVNTVYGAISGFLLILLWVYYFAQIIYVGAEITKVYATHYGSMKDQKKELIKGKEDLVDENE
jgi:membrane protein